jgi:hypothetical protein
LRLTVLLLTLMVLSALASTYVLSTSIYGDVRRVAGGTAEVKHYNVKTWIVADVVFRGFLRRVSVDVIVDVSGYYRVTLTVWNDSGSRTVSQTVYLTAGQTTTVTFLVTLRESVGEGFSHRVEVSPA